MHDVCFTILGSGTSAGVPVIGCDCEVCTSDDPRDNRLRPSAMLETLDPADGSHRVILIDTSPDLRTQALREKLCRCDAIFFTHHHVDHIFGLDEVRRFNVLMQQPINVYAEPETMNNIQRVYKHIFAASTNANNSFVATLIANPLTIGKPVDLFGLRFTPLRLMHGRLPIAGFRIDRIINNRSSPNTNSNSDENNPANDEDPLPLAYCTDVSSIPPETWPRLTGLQTLILDGLRPRHHPTHFNIDQAVQAASQINAAQTFLIHMTHNVLHTKLEAQLPPGIKLCYDGMKLGKLNS